MKVVEVAKLPPVERFLYWIRERHAIYQRRKAGRPKPWTDDEVLQRYFFTNPYREHDKTTVWFRENVREPLRDDPEVLFATVCFRWFNYIPTGQVLVANNLLVDWDLEHAVRCLNTMKSEGMQVFTGAFNISNSGSTKSKVERVCQDYIQPVWSDLSNLLSDAKRWTTLRQAHQRLKGYLGLGGSGFMAYEAVCDLRYTALLEHAKDKLTWSNPGPGAKRGLNRLLGRDLNHTCRDYPDHSLALLATTKAKLPKLPSLEMREIEHSLCEFDKYERARLGNGHLKRRYSGAGNS